MGVDAELAKLAAAIGLSDEQRRAVTSWAERSAVGSEATTLALDNGATFHEGGASTVPPLAEVATLPERYRDLGLIGVGGLGEVRRVHDSQLDRAIAMKVIRGDLLGNAEAVGRFVEEAHVSAQLQHPGIVPVHELGRMSDGRLYFTMKEVRGRTLTDVIGEFHHPEASEWTLRRLLDVFVKVSEAVGYAHARGVVHRDLKPDNVMVGAHGEVLVLDWGIAKLLATGDAVRGASPDTAAEGATRIGTIAGTAAYMSPEQAVGAVDRVDARSDVYALGAILYEVLAGRRPYTGRGILGQVLAGRPAPLPPGIPDELQALVERAMAREPADRFADATAIAVEARAWLDGARRREQALAVVDRAAATGPAAEALRTRAEALRAQAAEQLAEVERWASEDRKSAGWALEDEAARLDREVALLSLQEESLLRGALTHDPQLPEAHAALAARYRTAHARAESERDAEGASRAEILLREHLSSLPADHAERVRCATWLQGDGALSLATDPPGAEVELFRFQEHNRRLVATPERVLGRTPLVDIPLPMGSYLCVIRHPERIAVRYPVSVGRGERWEAPTPVPLPRADQIGAGERYVPPGWFWAGDPRVTDGLPRRRLWCDGLVFQRFPVTNRQYIAFLDDLVQQGREAEALAAAPRERAGAAGDEGALIYGRVANGRFALRPDAEGDLWEPDWPVMMLQWRGAAAYALWLAEKSGLPWRLPGELEWEKAARGVDGRAHPWGDGFDPSWCNMRDSRPGKPFPAPVDSFPVDESVYGVRGMGGNVQDWCGDAGMDPKESPPLDGGRVIPPLPPTPAELAVDVRRASRGGFWFGTPAWARCAYRHGLLGSYRNANLSVRAVRSWSAREQLFPVPP
jgi:serine/threonine-protein kinase